MSYLGIFGASPRSILTSLRKNCLAVALGFSLTVSLPAQTLQEAAAKFPGLRVGAALNPDTLIGSEAVYANTVRQQFNLPSTENATKWAALRPNEYTYDWADADAIIQFARAGGQQGRGHTLLWHQSIPSWVTALTNAVGFTPEQARDRLFHHIDTVAGRYRGDLFCWDVVNEAFNDNGTLRNSFWYNQPGIGYATNGTRYIEETFRRAALADPKAELIYNDYSAETDNAKSDAIYAMAQDFLSRGVPLHGIGFQMHRTGLDYNSLRTNFKRFNDLGLNLHVTEMDIRILVTNGVATPEALAAQAEVYWNIVGVALGQPRFTVLQTWGFTDKYSWIPGFAPGYGAALLFDENYQRKPAWWAVWNVMANQAERLAVLDVSAGDTTNVFNQAELSAGAGLQLQANATNDSMTLAAAVPFAGPWNVKVGYRQSGASGQFQLAVAPEGSSSFTDVGGVVEAYSATVGVGTTDLGTNTFATAGNWQFRFTIAGKNVSAADYNVTIDYIRITPADPATNTPPTISNVTDKTTSENTPAGPFAFTIGDAQTPAAALTVTAVSLNTNLLPSANLVLGGSGASRNVTLTPASNQFGTVAVLLLVSDGTNQTPETFNLRVTPVNTPPVVLATNLALVPGASVDVNLPALVTDLETAPAALRYEVSAPVGGTVTLLADGHTARFTANPNYGGAASFVYTATDTGPDARWLLHYDFESPDAADDQSVTDYSTNARVGTLAEFGLGLSTFETNVPPLLAPFSTGALALTEAGTGNGARLEALLPTTIASLRNADWSMATWFRRSAANNEDMIFHVGAGDGLGGDGDELDLYLTPGGQLLLRHYNAANVLDVNIAGPTLPVGEWHHVTVVFDRTASNAGLLKLYLDGGQVGATTAVTWALDQNYQLVFGGTKKGTEEYWLNGSLDDVALYGAVLSGAEVAALAAGRTVAHLGGQSRSSSVSFTLPFTNLPPTLGALSNSQIIAGVPLAVAASATDQDLPPQALTFSLLSAPAGAVINVTNGLVTWRPTLAQSGASHPFTVVVTEAGWQTNVAALADAYVRDGTYATSNYGADAVLVVKRDPTANFSRESLVKFALPSLPGTVANAQLRLQPVYANLPGTHAVALATNDGWEELTATWNTKPNSGAALATWVPQANVPLLIPVTAAVAEDVPANGLLSLRIYATNSTADGRVDYAAKEAGASGAPQLLLAYTNAQPLSATQSFSVTVSAPQPPVLSALHYSGSSFHMNVAGDGGPDYRVLTSTNLTNWEMLFATNGASGAFLFTVSNLTVAPQRFYRIELGP